MDLALSAEYFDQLAKMPTQVQARANVQVLKLRNNPSSVGLNFEKLKNANGLHSFRVSDNYRVIARISEKDSTTILLFIDKHDEAYRWAETHRCEVNSNSGTVQVFSTQHIAEVKKNQNKLLEQPKGQFANLKRRELHRLGVPDELVDSVLSTQDDSDLNELESILPADAYEALYYYLCGDSYEDLIERQELDDKAIDTTDLGKALSRHGSRAKFVVAKNDFELESMLNQPLAKWRVFLHPDQLKLVQRSWNGPVRVLGSAGTGKTVVALHRAKYLAQRLIEDSSSSSPNSSNKILFVTYVSTLVTDLKESLRSICSPEELKRIEVTHLDRWLVRFIKGKGFNGEPLFSREQDLWQDAMGHKPPELDFADSFYEKEFEEIILGRNSQTRSEYLTVSRTGRGMPLTRRTRAAVWPVFDSYLTALRREDKREVVQLYFDAAAMIENEGYSRYAHVIADEIQDFEAFKLQLLRCLVPQGQDDIFVVGDGKQRIFLKKPVVLGHCGIDIRGRGRKLSVNYRTTKEIERFATTVLAGHEYDDLDGGIDLRSSVMSLTQGPQPQIENLKSEQDHWDKLVQRIRNLLDQDVPARSICVVARTNSILDKTKNQLEQNNIPIKELRRRVADEGAENQIRICTAHRVKGLEFDFIFVVHCNLDTFPVSTVVRQLDQSEQERELVRERSLLYVASSRAKKELVVLSYGRPSLLLRDSVVQTNSAKPTS